MDLDRSTLARVDRRLLASLDQGERFQMVRVPVTAARWSTWKRYCDAAGISMGRAITALVDRELVSVFGESTNDEIPVFAARADEKLTARESQLDARERDLKAAEGRLRGWTDRLRIREGELQALEQHIQSTPRLAAQPREARLKVGRNERCPCGSGLKYKHCHGLTGRQVDGCGD